MMEKEKNPEQRGRCPECGEGMVFYPGCCGNLPLWRCDECGLVSKWAENQLNNEKYLKLK
jgi:hypothetical protein